jgi:glycosyltransferase involved in cell wall biosynthesis
MSEVVGVGVPAYRGAAYIADTLRSLERQTHRDLAVLISVDGADEATAAACAPFLADSRFTLVVQPTRLGWARNTSFVMAQNQSAFWHYLAQDDLIEPDYVSTLLAHACASPLAAVTFCDIQCFDRYTETIQQYPVLGPAAAREVALITAHHAAVALRGLTRQGALRHAGGLRDNEVENFSADTVWMASVARAGELHRVPGARYRKRYHGANVHTEWPAWPLEKRLKAWQVHCRDMFLEAVPVEATLPEYRLMWAGTVTRLVSAYLASSHVPASTFDMPARIAMLDGFLAGFTPQHVADTQAKLDLPFDQIAALSRALLGARRQSLLERFRSYRGKPDR